MYCKLSEKEYKMIQNVSNLTRIDYELINDLIPIDSFISIIYDLLNIIDYKEETIKEIKKDILENYKFIGDEYYD